MVCTKQTSESFFYLVFFCFFFICLFVFVVVVAVSHTKNIEENRKNLYNTAAKAYIKIQLKLTIRTAFVQK